MGATIIVASGSRKVQNIFVQFVQGVQSGRMGALLLFSDSLKRIKMYLALCALSTQTVRLTRWIGEHLTLHCLCVKWSKKCYQEKDERRNKDSGPGICFVERHLDYYKKRIAIGNLK